MKKKSCLFLSVCMMFLVAGCSKKIDLNEYLEVDYEGVNEYATATYQIDYEELISDYEEIFEIDEDDSEDVEEFLEDIEDAINGELNEDKNLKNGDELTFTWDVSAQEIEDEYKVKFEYADVNMLVEDLDELDKVDAFEGVEVTFEGPSGYATAQFSIQNQKYNVFNYDFSGGENLKNGDIVTVSLVEGYMPYCIEAGIIPKENTKTYMVAGLEELTTFDAFEGLKVNFSGNEPYGNISWDDRATKYDELNFTCKDRSLLSNGDEVIVELDQYSVEQCIRKYNMIPETTSKTYVVEGLDTLIMEYDDVAEEEWTEICESWRTYLLETMNSYWETPEALKDVKYIGRSLGKTSSDNEGTQMYSPIFITLFYEISVEQPEQEPFKYYYAIELSNLKKKADGTFEQEGYSEPGQHSGWFGLSGHTFSKENLYYIGFDTFAAAYEAYIINDNNGYNTFGEFIDGYEYVVE